MCVCGGGGGGHKYNCSQNMAVSAISSELINLLQPNLL